MLAAPLMPLAEPGWVTLIKIVGMLVLVMSIIPMILIFSPGSSREEPPDEPEEHH
jgi:hypothetical protein